jgi:hypothetical protein
LAYEAVDERIGVRPFGLSPVLPIVLCHEDQCGTQNVLKSDAKDISVPNASEGGRIRFQLGSEKAGVEGARAEPAAGSVHVEHASEYFRVEVG